MMRGRGVTVRVTARLVEDNPDLSKWLIQHIGHDITAIRAGGAVHHAQFCQKCGGKPG